MDDDKAVENELVTGAGSNGIKAVETGMQLLVALAQDNSPQMLKALASRADMHPAKAHRYLVSFLRTGLVQRDPETGYYRFGPLAMQIGVAALGSLNIVRFAATEVGRLRDELGVTVALGVWGVNGATHVLIEESHSLIIAKSRLGSILPLLSSATGRMFAAHLPEFVIDPIIDAELNERTRSATARAKLRTEFYHSLEEIRRDGVSRAMGSFSPGIHALCCPIRDYRGTVAASLTILAPAGVFDPEPAGPAAQVLRRATARLSAKMGAPDPEDKKAR